MDRGARLEEEEKKTEVELEEDETIEAELEEDETVEAVGEEDFSSSGADLATPRGREETKSAQPMDEMDDPLQIKDGVLKMLAETDWEIEPVEERNEASLNEPSDAVPTEAGTDGQVAEMSVENRPFLEIILGGESYCALLDSGAMVSLAGPRVIARYENRLKQSTTTVKSVTVSVNRVVGDLKVSLEVGGHMSTLAFKAIQGIDHDLILGMDFFESFDVELRPGKELWRSKE